MHWTMALIWAAVIWAAVGGFFRVPALFLVAGWMIGQCTFLITGEYVPTWLYYPLDLIVMAGIYRYRSTALDWVILAIFPAQWAFYPSGDGAWWPLYFLALAQLILAGPWPQFMKIGGSVQHGPARGGSEGWNG